MKAEKSNQIALEFALIIVILGLTGLMYQVVGFKMVVLNLFFLPVLLGAFFLGRYRAGVLALLSVSLVTIVAAQDFSQFAALKSPLSSALAITIWAGVLGLTTILAGTVSDERTSQMAELHTAYFGVIEVLSRHLHGVHPHLQDRPLRIADLSQRIGAQLRLTERELDDLRIASLLQEMDQIEITARVVRKSIGAGDTGSQRPVESTFHAADLVQSLGAAINGALPLLCQFDENLKYSDPAQAASGTASPPLGAHIIRTARSFDTLVFGQESYATNDPQVALGELQSGLHGKYPSEVLDALRHVIQSQASLDTKRQTSVVAVGTAKPTTLPIVTMS